MIIFICVAVGPSESGGVEDHKESLRIAGNMYMPMASQASRLVDRALNAGMGRGNLA